MSAFLCPRCQNSDPIFIGYLNGKPYCRRCIAFNGEEAPKPQRKPSVSPVVLNFKLSDDQLAISNKVRENYKNGINTLIYAVCGAGKTELVYGVIADALRLGKTVGFALPRRDVVIELYWRLKEAFPEDKVVAVYGGHTKNLIGDIIILTTHQIYRYPKYFDLLVMDEIDAFPFKGSDILHTFYEKSINGNVVLMSATPSKELIEKFNGKGHQVLELKTRFHRHEIPVPKIVLGFTMCLFLKMVKELKFLLGKGKPVFIFCPTIGECERVFSFLKHLVKGGACVHSKDPDRQIKIENFKKSKLKYLVTTSILERGITIKHLQVFVFHADREDIYDSSTLIQISGRVGRKWDAPNGKVIFYAKKRTKSIDTSITNIKECNRCL